MDKKDIGAKLRNFRESKNLNAKDVSDLLMDRFSISLNYKSLYNYENGRTSPNPDVLLALCSIYEVKNPLIEFDDDYSVGNNAFYSSPNASAAGVGPWLDESFFGSDFSESEWSMLKKYVDFLIYCRKDK